MIIVHSEKIVKETFGLIQLDLYFHGHPICLKVDANLSEHEATYIQRLANRILADKLSDLFDIHEPIRRIND